MSAAGLPGRIRACTDSDEFDLSGYSREQCNNLAKAAFEEPLELNSMIRITFVVGGGKLCRQKYSDDLPRDLFAALTAIGYDDDKAAACELDSGGRYKYQHDTSKNLKFVHVFPRVKPPSKGNDADEAENDTAGATRSPADLLAECELDEFKRLVASQVTLYSQLKRLLDELKTRLSRLDAAEQKLISRESLEPSEQALYDSLSAEGLREKVKLVSAQLQACVDGCRLTAPDNKEVLEQLDSKLKILEIELGKAEERKMEPLVEKLVEQRSKLKTMRAAVNDASAIQPPPLKHGEAIRKLRQKLTALAKMEKESSGKYSMDELKRLGEKPDIEDALQVYEERCRLWFETDEQFQFRLQRNLREGPPPKKPAAGNGGYGGGAAASSNGGFTAVGGKAKKR